HVKSYIFQILPKWPMFLNVARKFLNEVKSTIVTLQRVIKHRMTLDTHNWSSSAHQELHKIVKDKSFPIVNQVDARVQNFEIQFLKEAAKFFGDFKSLEKEADESLAKHKALELEIERLLRAVVSQDIMFVVQNNSVGETSNLQTELDRMKERFENCIIKKENEYAKLWIDWYKKCEECKFNKISYDKAYNDMQQKIERLQAQLGELNGKSKDTSCVSDTLNPLSQKLENENVELKFQVLNYAKENAHLKTTYKNLFHSISMTRTQTKTIIDSLQNKLHDMIYENSKLRAQLFDTVSDQKDTSRGTSANTKNKKHMSFKCNNVKLATQNVKSKVVCAMCKQCLISVNHVVCLLNYVNGMTSRGKKQKPKVKKTKKVRSIERLASPKPSKPRSFLRWSSTGRMFDLKGKIIASSESESQSDYSKGDNAYTSNPLEPTIKRFPNSTFLWQVIQICLWCVDSGCSKHMTENLQLLINFVWKFLGTVRFENEHVAAILGFGDLQWENILITRVYFVEGLGHNLSSVGQFCGSNLEVAFRRNACFIRNLKGVDLLSGKRTTNLYTINLHEMSSASLICLMARASSTKSWLWHQRLSHLNFDTINDLAKNDLVSGLPKFKYHKEHLCPSCEQGKSKRASHPPKPVPNFRQRLPLLHMDLCGPMRIASINEKWYILVIMDDYSRYTWVHFLRSKDEAPEVIKTFLKRISILLQSLVIIIRTDNGIEFKNQILKEYFDGVGISHQVSSVRTPQQNIVERRNRTLVKAARTIRKPDISFLHVFGALCYPKNDREDIGKLSAKGDIGFFIGYSADSCAFRVYNRRTKRIMETMNVSFEELSAMDFEQRTEGESDLLFEAMYDDYIGGQPSAALRTVPAVQAHQDRQTPTTSTSIADTAPTPTNSSSQATIFPNTSQDVDELISQQQHAQQQGYQAPIQPEIVADNVPNAMFDANTFVNPFATPSTSVVESSSSQYEDPSNMHTFYQPHPHEFQWTKDHPPEQVIGEPSRPVLTRNQLRSDGDMCMYALTLKKALYGLKQAPPAWCDELLTFLLQNHFFKGTIDPTLFIRNFIDDILVVQVYVDDIIFGSTHPKYTQLFSDLIKSRFEMSMMGEMTFFLGLQVNQSPCNIFLNQSNYVLEILKLYGMKSCDPIGTPMEIKDKLDLDQNRTPVDAIKYRSMIGALMYLTSSKPDIVHGTCLCARYQAKPTEKHLKEVKRIFHYLRGTVNTSLWYTKESGFELTGFLDADYAGCKDTFKSTFDEAQFLGEKLVSWSSKKQDCTALSTAKAEYVSLSACCAQVLWTRTQLTDYGFHFNKIPIYCDSK
nr:hypothetical protein [Tanacetum cinerariifolium]